MIRVHKDLEAKIRDLTRLFDCTTADLMDRLLREQVDFIHATHAAAIRRLHAAQKLFDDAHGQVDIDASLKQKKSH